MPFDLDSNIMFYGPTSAGKSSILAAFQYAMIAKSRQIAHSQGRLSIVLKTAIDQQDTSLVNVTEERCNLEQIGPTEDFMQEHSLFSFHRSAKDSRDEQAVLSSAQHKGLLRSPKGTDFAQDITNRLLQRTGAQTTTTVDPIIETIIRSNLDESHTIIVVLNGDENNRLANNIPYADFIRPLLLLSPTVGNIPRHLAFCVTKVDKNRQLRLLTDRDVLLRFGITDVYDQLKELEFKLKVFRISPWGFLIDNLTSNSETNANLPAGQTYLEKTSWKPYLIHEPFFWAFQGVERALLESEAENRNWLEKKVYPTKQVLADYIPYDPKYDES